jgi:leucyl/phenylalanyl-tRNA--protein transferase
MRTTAWRFPDPEAADATGLVCTTPTLSPELVLTGYRQGLFPWSDPPVRWYCPEVRAVFLREHMRLPRRIQPIMRKAGLHVTFDQAFSDVIAACREAHRGDGVWISELFIDTYRALHEDGHAHSVEVWQGDKLVGGLYGVQQGALFCGESMFHLVPNASKVAFAHLVGQLDHIGTLLLDSQVPNAHTVQLGAVGLARSHYLALLPRLLSRSCLYDGTKWPKNPPPFARRLVPSSKQE